MRLLLKISPFLALLLWFQTAFLLVARPVESAFLRVGPGQPFPLPSAAAQAARDGDTILIDSGQYEDCAFWSADRLTILAVGGRVKLTGPVCAGKALWVIQGDETRVEGIDFFGMQARDGNGAGIRHEGAGLTIVRCGFEEGESGILGGGQRPGDVVRVQQSRFFQLGRGGQAHPIYIGRADALIFENNQIRECRHQANCLKSRAQVNLISGNRIDGDAGNSSWELDFPNGGQVELTANRIRQGPQSANRGMLAFALEGSLATLHTHHRLTLIDNLFLDASGRGRFLSLREGLPVTTRAAGNRFVAGRTPPAWALDPLWDNRQVPDREAAGLPAVEPSWGEMGEFFQTDRTSIHGSETVP